jgi:hypothetical protein
MRWRERLGEKFSPNTPLFRQTFDTITQINQPKPMRPKGVSGRINKLLEDSGKTELMETHGLRKFFKTPEYKRKYTTKSEVSSLSKENMKGIEVDAQGNSISEPESKIFGLTETSSENQSVLPPHQEYPSYFHYS